MADKDDLGRRGEDVAAAWFESQGYTVIERNWRCKTGELDLILQHGETTVFAEVKTRTSVAFGHPFEAISRQKASRLRQLAAEWCRQHETGSAEIRIDIVGVLDAWSAEPTIEHVRGAL